ncbi:MAG: hypothetical protein PHU53_01245 [Thermoplasmata archaeon]|nr:hypothetical protein [Thermoplasmata archaeon]
MQDRKTEMDYEKITIYPFDYDAEKRQELHTLLKKLGIKFNYENWN